MVWAEWFSKLPKDDKELFSYLKKHWGSNHAKSGKLIDLFMNTVLYNQQHCMWKMLIPLDNYDVRRVYCYLSYWMLT